MTVSNIQSKHVTKSRASKSHVTKPAAVAAPNATPEPAAAASQASSAAATPSPSEPLQARVTGALAFVSQAMTMLAIALPPLSPSEVKAATKLRKGGEAQIPALVEMSGQYGVEVPSRPTADMAANVAEAQVLAPLVALVARFLTLLESASFQVRSEAWATATTLYQMLRKASVRQPALKADLAPLEAFFSYRHPLVTETAPKTQVQLAKETKRQQNAAKRLKRLQDAAAAAGVVVSETPAATPGPNGSTPPAPPAAPATPGTPSHS